MRKEGIKFVIENPLDVTSFKFPVFQKIKFYVWTRNAQNM
jgi:hypothetical protein